MDGDGEAAVDLVVGPDLGRVGDVAGLRGVDAIEHAPAAAVRRVLADRHVDAVVLEDGRGDDLAGTDVGAVVVVAAVLADVAVG